MTEARGTSNVASVVEVLAVAERHLALLTRCIPSNANAERERLTHVWQLGGGAAERAPRWVLGPAPQLAEVRRALSRAMAEVDGEELAPLYVERAEELLLEAELVEARGQPRFRELARLRYPCAPAELDEARAWAEQVLADDAVDVEPPDEASAESSLTQALVSRLAALGVVANVVERDDLASVAAVGEGVVYVGASAPRDPAQVARVVLHEVDGHLLPRLRSKTESIGLLRVASRGAGEDEEGRALWLEEREGHWDPSTRAGRVRRRELALRHLAAELVRQGGAHADVMELLLERGVAVPAAVQLSERVLRGGGLAREIAYLPAHARVRRAFDEDPELERWFERGRVSLDAARRLEGVRLSGQSKSTTTGT